MVTSENKHSDFSAHSMEMLLCEALSGSALAYEQFLTLATRHLRRFVTRRVQPADIEDVVQEILISIHKARHTYDGKRAVMPWISAIARYRLMDYLRRHYADKQQMKVDISEVEDFLSEDVTESNAMSESINMEIAQLPQRQQKILYLLHTEGFTAKEVGAQLGMKESAVKVAAHRAYKHIKAKLANSYG